MTPDLRALEDLTYGVYIVGARNLDGKINAMISNSVFQVTASPCKLAACIHKESLTYEYIKTGGFFTVQPVKEGADMVFIGNWGFRTGRDFDKFAKYKYELTPNNLPCVLENVLDILEVKVINALDLGTHVMFIGETAAAKILADGKPLTYAYYKQIMRGKTPRGATTFIKN